MKQTQQEYTLEKFYSQFKVKTPKRLTQCHHCGDYFKNELMYCQPVRINDGIYGYCYCVDCYIIIERDKLIEAGIQ